MSGQVEPLLDIEDDERRDSKAEADSSIWCYYLQVSALFVYMILACVLPERVSAMAEAAHIASMHVLVFVIVVFFLALSARHVYGPESQHLPPFFPITPLLAQQGLFLTTVVNACLLLIVGAESWLRRELGQSFSVMNVVQLLAIIEGAVALLGASVVTYRLVQYIKVSALAGDDGAGNRDDDRRGTGRWSIVEEGGRLQRSRTQSFRINDSGGGASGKPRSDSGMPSQQYSSQASAALAEAQGHIRALQSREEQLSARVAELSATLAAQLEAGGESVSAAALRCANEHVLELQAEHARLAALLTEGDKRRAYYEVELQRAANDVARYHEALKLEKRRTEKLLHSLDAEKDANLHVQAEISDLRQILEVAGARGSGAEALGGGGEDAHAAAYAAARPVTAPISLTSPSAAGRSVPPRVSFGGALDGFAPSRSINSPTPYGSPAGGGGAGGIGPGTGSSRRLLALTSKGGGGGGGGVAPLGSGRTASGSDIPLLGPPSSSGAPQAAGPLKTPRRAEGGLRQAQQQFEGGDADAASGPLA